MAKLKKISLWIVGVLLFSIIIGSIVTPQEVKDKQPTKKESTIKDLSVTAHTICKIIVEQQLTSAAEINFPFANRKIFKKDNQRYIVKDYVIFEYNGIKQKANWHCDLQFIGGNEIDTNNWKILNFEILTL